MTPTLRIYTEPMLSAAQSAGSFNKYSAAQLATGDTTTTIFTIDLYIMCI